MSFTTLLLAVLAVASTACLSGVYFRTQPAARPALSGPVVAAPAQRSVPRPAVKALGLPLKASEHLDQVAEEFAKAGAGGLLQLTREDGDYRPAELAPGWLTLQTDPDPSADVRGVRVELGPAAIVGTYLHKPKRLPVGAVGLAWVESQRFSDAVWFVTLDGERHVVNPKNLAPYKPGAPVAEPFQNEGLAPNEVLQLARDGAMPDSYAAKLRSIENELIACAEPDYTRTKAKVAELEARYIESARLSELKAKEYRALNVKIYQKCSRFLTETVQGLERAVSFRLEQRKALYQRTSALVGRPAP
jgi:hypothetical protein